MSFELIYIHTGTTHHWGLYALVPFSGNKTQAALTEKHTYINI